MKKKKLFSEKNHTGTLKDFIAVRKMVKKKKSKKKEKVGG